MFHNSLKLTKFMLKRERVISTAWILSLVIINFLILLLMGGALLADDAERAQMMGMLENPALLAMVGPLYSTEISDIGALYTLMMLVFICIAVGVMNVFLVTRHTRSDEEAGRYEVLRSLPVGRLASVHAAMLTAIVINAVLALLSALTMWLGMIIVGAPMGFGAALLWGSALGALGIVFAAIAAMFCQMSASSRGASGYSFALMGLFYFLRAGADMNPEEMGFLAFFSPFGLISRTWVYVHNYWWPVLVVLGAAGLFAGLSYWLCGIRDIDQGLIPARPGKARGGLLMRSAFGLNFRLTRMSLIVWILVLFFTGLSYAVVLDDIDSFVAGNHMYRTMLIAPTGLLGYLEVEGHTTEQIAAQMNELLAGIGVSIPQMFANMVGFMMAMMATVPALMFVLKARGEERASRGELILATSTSKTTYLMSFVIISFASAVLVQIAYAVGLYSMPSDADLPFVFLIQSALVYVPAIWVMSGLAMLLIGLAPKRAGWIWAYHAFAFFAMMYGRMLPDLAWMANITPFGHVPQLPVDEINWATLALMTALAATLTTCGLFFYRKRDVNRT